MLASLALTALCSLSSAPQDRAQANPWAQWSAGSWVLYGIDNPVSGPLTSKLSLTAVGETSYTCREESTWPGSSKTEDSPASLARFGYPHALPQAREVGRETVRVGGREFACSLWSARYPDEGATWESVAWVAPDCVHPLRVLTKGPLQLDLELDKLEDFVLIGKRKFKGARYTGTITQGGRRSGLTQWRSSDIPGGLLRSVTTTERDGKQVVLTTIVRELRGTRLE